MSEADEPFDAEIARNRAQWTMSADDWAGIQEPLGTPLYYKVLGDAGVSPGTTLLDAGCGGGVAARIATHLGADVKGVDVTPALVEIARRRVPAGEFVVGDIEHLPVADDAYDVVTAFSSIMFAADPARGAAELRRAVKPAGVVAVAVPDPEKSDIWRFLEAVGAVLDAGSAAAAEALSLGPALSSLLAGAGLEPRPHESFGVEWHYRNDEIMTRAVTSAGPIAGAAQHLGADTVGDIARRALDPFRQADGSYRMAAAFTIVVADA